MDYKRIDVKKFDPDRHIKLKTIDCIANSLSIEPAFLREICFIHHSQIQSKTFITNGARYCPFCLEEDGLQPYFRYYWRLTFVTVCIKHSCFLQEHCPKCYSLVRYWDTDFNQPISSCYKCGTNLINAKISPKIIENTLLEGLKFQDYFIKIFKTERWRGKTLTRRKFLKLLWQLAWTNKEELLDFYHTENYEPWEQYSKRLCYSLEETAHTFSVAFQTIRLDPETLKRPFVCPVEGRKFARLKDYLEHRITHLAIKCPLTTCQAEELRILKEGYLCRTCGTTFKTDGTIIKTGIKLSCPLQNCKSSNVRFGEQGYRCRTCGTVFMKDGAIIKVGVKLSCPHPNCGSKSIRAENETFKCKICGTVFKLDGSIIVKGKKQLCLLEDCGSKNIRTLKKEGYRCRMCGTTFKRNGQIVKRGKKTTCPLKECRSKSVRALKEIYQCKMCGTEFKLDGSFVKKGKIQRCPLKNCSNENMHVLKTGYRCRVCGTEFKMDGTITKQGKKMKCPRPCCNTSWIIALKQGYRCTRCHTRFNSDGIILEKGKQRPLSKCKRNSLIVPIKGCEMCAYVC